MGEGIKACGISIEAVNDLQKEMGLFQLRQGQKSVVVGDIGDPAIVATLHSACQSPALVSGGFSCQPWSALGDKRKSGDPRSGSLVKLLRLAFWLRAHSVILECVSEAGEDQEVQNIIARFCKLTGFNQSQAVLHLESIVPAKRTRWWCMLSNASVPGFCIRPLPKMHPAPNVGDIFPTFPQWDPQDLTQLELDHYETNKFMEFGGLFENLVNVAAPLKTAWVGQPTYRVPLFVSAIPFF